MLSSIRRLQFLQGLVASILGTRSAAETSDTSMPSHKDDPIVQRRASHQQDVMIGADVLDGLSAVFLQKDTNPVKLCISRTTLL